MELELFRGGTRDIKLRTWCEDALRLVEKHPAITTKGDLIDGEAPRRVGGEGEGSGSEQTALHLGEGIPLWADHQPFEGTGLQLDDDLAIFDQFHLDGGTFAVSFAGGPDEAPVTRSGEYRFEAAIVRNRYRGVRLGLATPGLDGAPFDRNAVAEHLAINLDRRTEVEDHLALLAFADLDLAPRQHPGAGAQADQVATRQ